MPSVGKELPHESARAHVTGEAAYLDDVPMMRGELLAGFVGSPVAHGRVVLIDLAAAQKIPGVVGVYTHQDVPGHNLFGPVVQDEDFLVEQEAQYLHQPIVLIAAETREALEAAKKAVSVRVEKFPAIFTIHDAIKAKSFIGTPRKIARGDADAALKTARHVLEGQLRIGGQEHFYLESQAAISYPGEDGQVIVHSSTQNPSEIQHEVAHALGLGMHQVICICKRMGGGFGGKETQAAIPAIATALIATKTGRPCRWILDKDTDMKITGKRHPYVAKYKVGFDDAGMITAYRLDLYSNAGCSLDLSWAVMERSMLHADNAYFIPNVHITGTLCKTNLPSNTAFRGFGGPQGVAVIENALQEIAGKLGLDAWDVRRKNLYGHTDRNTTPYGQTVQNNLLPDIFDQLEKSGDYRRRIDLVKAFNASSRTQLRGLAVTAVKFGISFTNRMLNQANALVNVYWDGTVSVSTGGTEMGQGLNTKIRQLVADEFGIDVDEVAILPTSTDKNNNTSPTAASASTDLNGTAAVRACQAIKARLAEFAAGLFASPSDGFPRTPECVAFADGFAYDLREPGKRIKFKELANLARRDRVNLGERGFYATPGVDLNRETGRGTPFLYYTTGAALAEVLIDRFTGMMSVPRVDLLMDVGQMINPGVDRGQVIGGFIQGMGWVTAEELRYSAEGDLLSYSPTTYKIPNITDTPATFNVAFMPNTANVRNIRASKAVGEPPLMLGICVWAAVKHALSFANGVKVPPLAIPATNEEIVTRLAEMGVYKRQPAAT